MESVAILDRLDPRDLRAQPVHRVRRDQPDFQDPLDHLVLSELPDSLDQQETWDRKETRERQGSSVRLDPQDNQDQLVKTDLRDSKDRPGQQDSPGQPESVVALDQLDR